MRNTLHRGLVALILVLLAACSQVQAPAPETAPEGLDAQAQVTIARLSAKRASASFSSTSVDGCIYTDVWVSVYSQKSRGIDSLVASEDFSMADVYIYQVDYCDEDNPWRPLVGAYGSALLTKRDFTIRTSLNSARLRTSVELHDWVSDERYTVDVALNWKGTGELWQDREHSRDKAPNFRRNSLQQWSSRSSEVSGSVTRGSSNLIQGMSYYSWLSRSQEMTVTIDRRAPVIEQFEAWPQTIYEGQATYLNWSVTGPDGTRLSIDQGIGDVTGEYGVMVAPTTTTTYTLTATHKRKSSSAQVTVVVLPRPEPDQYEPNDDPGAATPIALAFSSPELNIVPGDVDWFRFTLTRAATVIADIDAQSLGSSLDSVMGLFDAGLNEVAINDDSCDEYDCSLDSYLEHSLAPGTYYLAVSGYDDFGFSGNHPRAGFYYLNVRTAP